MIAAARVRGHFGVLAVALLASANVAAGEGPHGASSAAGSRDVHQAEPHEDHGADADHGPGEINWFHGFLGEQAGVEPSVLWRPVGMPAPFGATLLNSAILFFLLFRFGSGPVREGLKKRKQTILQGFDEAGKMKDAASERLAEYERKLASLDQEIERVRVQMREAAEAERLRVLSEAKERRERMERDAHLLIEQELKAAREMLLRETAQGALKSAESLIRQQLSADDKQRTLQEYLATVGSSVSQSNTLGATRGRA